jgi:hypothetical protein
VVAVNHTTFIRLNYSFHQVCSSIYVSQQWILHLNDLDDGSRQIKDFRVSATRLFQALRAFCELVSDSIADGFAKFYSNNYISFVVTPRKQLESQSDALIQQFISTTVYSSLLYLRTIRDSTQANAFLSALKSNYILYRKSDWSFTYFDPMVYGNNCSCYSNSTCVEQATIYRNNSLSTEWFVPGFYRGCFIVEALRQSHLECLYNETCLTQLHSHLQSLKPMLTATLNSSMSSRFMKNTSIGDMLEQLMVEEWKRLIDHDAYYAACHPVECQYTVTVRSDAIYIVTTIIGLIGGLVTALELIVPLTVRLIAFVLKRWKRNTVRNSNNNISQRLNDCW